MKKVVMLVVIFSGMIWGQIDYTKYDWKKGKEEVKKTETLKLLEENKDSLVFETNYYGYLSRKIYCFNENKIGCIKYDVDYKNIKKYNHEEKKKLMEKMIKEYGMFDTDSAVPMYLTDEQIWEMKEDILKGSSINPNVEYYRSYFWEKDKYSVRLTYIKYKKVMRSWREIEIVPNSGEKKIEYGH